MHIALEVVVSVNFLKVRKLIFRHTQRQNETIMQKKLPYLNPLIIFLLIIASCTILFYGSPFLIPLTYGMMFAFLVNPIHSKLRDWNWNKYLSAITSVSVIVLFILILLGVFGWQIQQLVEQKSEIKKELIKKQEKVQSLTKKYFGVSPSKQEDYAEKVINKMGKNAKGFVGSFTSLITNFFLSLVYAILLLSERKRIQSFFYGIFNNEDKAENTIDQTGEVIQKYLSGKLIIIGILATVYAIGFSIAGIKYGVLIAIFVAFLTFIPYAGNIIGGVIAALITFATGGSMTEIAIIFGVMGAAQLIESYILEPWIVGSNVDLNPLFAILGVISLSLIWGAAGAIIALPLVGILKVFFDKVENYKSIGFLMGNDKVD